MQQTRAVPLAMVEQVSRHQLHHHRRRPRRPRTLGGPTASTAIS